MLIHNSDRYFFAVNHCCARDFGEFSPQNGAFSQEKRSQGCFPRHFPRLCHATPSKARSPRCSDAQPAPALPSARTVLRQPACAGVVYRIERAVSSFHFMPCPLSRLVNSLPPLRLAVQPATHRPMLSVYPIFQLGRKILPHQYTNEEGGMGGLRGFLPPGRGFKGKFGEFPRNAPFFVWSNFFNLLYCILADGMV